MNFISSVYRISSQLFLPCLEGWEKTPSLYETNVLFDFGGYVEYGV